MAAWQIGELARRTGLTPRTLHHWDAIGLLRPSGRSAGGYRLYGEDDLRRLHRIQALRSLGLSLAEVGRLLADPACTAADLVKAQVERLRERIRQEKQLLEKLEEIAGRLDSMRHRSMTLPAEAVSAEEVLQIVEMSNVFEKHYTPEQRATLARRAEELGPETIRAVEEEWPRLIAQVRSHMEQGTPPDGEQMRPLAQRWRELVGMFTGGDAGIAASLREMYRTEPTAMERSGLDPALMEYVGRAMAAIGGW